MRHVRSLVSGEPMMIGNFDELPFEGRQGELRHHLDDNDKLIAPYLLPRLPDQRGSRRHDAAGTDAT